MAIAFRIDPRARTTAKTRPITISEKYSAGPKMSASFVSGAPSAAITMVATVPAKNDPMAAMPERNSGPALPGHLVPVEGRDHGGGLARNVDQDGGGRTAVLRAVIDAGQHDESADRLKPEGDR